MKFGIITYIPHALFENSFFSYSPYIREMDLWMEHADETLVLAPLEKRPPTGSEISYTQHLSFIEVPAINFLGFRNTLRSVLKIPFIFFKIWQVCREADHIHLRCPGNISLLGCIVQIFFPKKPKTVKYAGNWDSNSRQPWSYRLQKWILSNTFLSRNIKVLVYGKWPDQSANVVSFFTASYSEEETENRLRDYSEPLKFIFVGSLSEGKQPFFAIKLVEGLLKKGKKASLKIFGTGILKKELEEYIENSKFSQAFSLEGFSEKESLKKEYLEAHFLILASKSEGWPKAVAEAMYFGSIPVATPVSCVPWMLAKGKRGILIPDNPEMAEKMLYEKLSDELELERMSVRAQEWSQTIYSGEISAGNKQNLL